MMKTAAKLPSYRVEFLPLERRLLDRRNLQHHFSFLRGERRALDRRRTSAEAGLSNSSAA